MNRSLTVLVAIVLVLYACGGSGNPPVGGGKRPVPVLVEHIRRRGREIEQQISPAYLDQIQQAYFEYLKTETETPVVILELGDLDFQQDDEQLDAILRLLEQPFPKGLSYLQLG